MIPVVAYLSCLLPLCAGFATVQHRKPTFTSSAQVLLYREANFVSLVEPTAVLEPIPETTMTQEPITELVAPVSVIKLTWEAEVEQTIRRAVMEQLHRAETPSEALMCRKPYMVAVVGIPGSGKSTSCSILTGLLRDIGCLLMPFDGYHYSISQLKLMNNPDDLIYRRGAPDTFDVESLKRDLELIRSGDVREVKVPGFDHAAGDPEPEAHTFDREQHRVVITEGLYLLHDQAGWEEVKNFFDLTIYVHADVDVCVERLKDRNKCIPGYTPEEIEVRCELVDRVNAEVVHKSLARADLVVQSAATIPTC